MIYQKHILHNGLSECQINYGLIENSIYCCADFTFHNAPNLKLLFSHGIYLIQDIETYIHYPDDAHIPPKIPDFNNYGFLTKNKNLNEYDYYDMQTFIIRHYPDNINDYHLIIKPYSFYNGQSWIDSELWITLSGEVKIMNYAIDLNLSTLDLGDICHHILIDEKACGFNENKQSLIDKKRLQIGEKFKSSYPFFSPHDKSADSFYRFNLRDSNNLTYALKIALKLKLDFQDIGQSTKMALFIFEDIEQRFNLSFSHQPYYQKIKEEVQRFRLYHNLKKNLSLKPDNDKKTKV